MTVSGESAEDASAKYLKAQEKIASLKEEEKEARRVEQRVYNSLLDSASCLLSASSILKNSNQGVDMARVGIYIENLARFLSPHYTAHATAGNALTGLLDEHDANAIRRHVNSIEIMAKETLERYRHSRSTPSPTSAQIVEQVTVLFGWIASVNDTSRCVERWLFDSYVKDVNYFDAVGVKELTLHGLVVISSALKKLAVERQLEATTKRKQEKALALSTIKTYEAEFVAAKRKKEEEIAEQTNGWGHW